MAHDVFISHSTQDKAVADAVCAALENVRIRCWIAPRDVQPGRSFAGEIARALKKSKAMVLIFSAHSNNSEQVLREVQLAVTAHLHIVQFRIEDVRLNDDLSYFLSTPHWLDALTPPLENHIDRLGTAIRVLLGTPAEQSVTTATSSETQTAATVAQRFASTSSSPPEKRDTPANVPQEQAVSLAGKALRPSRGRKFMFAGAIVALLVAAALGTWWFGIERPRKNADRQLQLAVPSEILRDLPLASPVPNPPWMHENSLGMKFVYVRETGVFFSIWTRVKDYRLFVEATKREWEKPSFQQTDEDPVVNVSWEDATAFCEWLTEKERKAGLISTSQNYRLPSDREWSAAMEKLMRGTTSALEENSKVQLILGGPEGNNRWLWCQDLHNTDINYRVLRLAGFSSSWSTPETRDVSYGFRCVFNSEYSR